MFFPFGFDNSLVVLLILQVVRKELPDEKVGVVCVVDGKHQVTIIIINNRNQELESVLGSM